MEASVILQVYGRTFASAARCEVTRQLIGSVAPFLVSEPMVGDYTFTVGKTCTGFTGIRLLLIRRCSCQCVAVTRANDSSLPNCRVIQAFRSTAPYRFAHRIFRTLAAGLGRFRFGRVRPFVGASRSTSNRRFLLFPALDTPVPPCARFVLSPSCVSFAMAARRSESCLSTA